MQFMYRVFARVLGELPQVIQVFVVIVWRLSSFDCLPSLLILCGSQNNTFVSNLGRLNITVLVEWA